jgi:hypothetical protein
MGICEIGVGKGGEGGVGGETPLFFPVWGLGRPWGAMCEVGDSGNVILDEAVPGRPPRIELTLVPFKWEDEMEDKDKDIGRVIGTGVG